MELHNGSFLKYINLHYKDTLGHFPVCIMCMYLIYTYCNHLGYITLRASVLSRILHPHQNHEVKVVPHVVFTLDVFLKGHRFVVKFVSFQPWKTLAPLWILPLHDFAPHMHASYHTDVHTADETGGFEDLLLPLFLTPQVCKRVNDDTKDEVENNDDDNEEKQKVVNHSGRKQRLLEIRTKCRISLLTTRKCHFLYFLYSYIYFKLVPPLWRVSWEYLLLLLHYVVPGSAQWLYTWAACRTPARSHRHLHLTEWKQREAREGKESTVSHRKRETEI